MADHEPGHVTEAVKEAAAVQAVQLLFAVAMIAVGVAMQVAQRHASEPDFVHSLGMAWAKRCERGWAGVAGVCWRRAETFRRDYERQAGAH